MITVLMATCQGEKYLEQQLDSILAQTYPVRILISDDGSTDRTMQILEAYGQWYPKQVVLCESTKVEDHGTVECGKPKTTEAVRAAGKRVGAAGMSQLPPAAANFFHLLQYAKEEGKSDYIMLADQDDVWFNNKAKKLYGRMRRLEAMYGKNCPILIHSDMEVVNGRTQQISKSFFAYQHCRPERTSFPEVLVENPVTGAASMMNRALLELAAEMPESCCMHDWWIALTASCFGVIDCIRQPLYQYRQHGNNTLGAKRTGSLGDLKERLGRRQQVEESYGAMMAQARAFKKQFQDCMPAAKLAILNDYLRLPAQSPVGRLRNVVLNQFYKSSPLQTCAMCLTLPGKAEKVEKAAGDGQGKSHEQEG